MDAEATALLAATEFALSLPDAWNIELHLHFDCSSVGFGMLGEQAIPTSHGQLSVRQQDARILTTIWQRKSGVVKGHHVHSHEGNPFNEMADGLASSIRQGWHPPHPAHLRSTTLMQHPLKAWAWLQVRPTIELPSLVEALAGSPMIDDECAPDATCKACKPSPKRTGRYQKGWICA